MVRIVSLVAAGAVAVSFVAHAAFVPRSEVSAGAPGTSDVHETPDALRENDDELRAADALARVDRAVRDFAEAPASQRESSLRILRVIMRGARDSAPAHHVERRINALEKTLDFAGYDALVAEVAREKSGRKRRMLEQKLENALLQAAARARAPFPLR